MSLEVSSLKKYFPVQKGWIESLLAKKKDYVKAVDGIGFSVQRGEIFGIVGESGSGKTTTGRLCAGLIEPTEGYVKFNGIRIAGLGKKEQKELRQRMQMIFQDPNASLNPRMRVREAISRPLRILGKHTEQEIRNMVLTVLDSVSLLPAESFLDRFPFELSGGQRQRVSMARSIVLEPDLIVADEPIAMVDVSVRAQIIEMIEKMKNNLNTTFLFITHDLASAKYLCQRIAIMYAGRIVEVGPAVELFRNPQHPYTKALISSVAIPDPKQKAERMIIGGEVPSLINPPGGCRFHPRCPYAQPVCRTQEPVLEAVGAEHQVACIPKPFLK